MSFSKIPRRALLLTLFGSILPLQHLAAADGIIPNGTFEALADGWPESWAKPKEGGALLHEGGNHFLRLESPAPGTNVMLYQEYKIPAGTEALTLKWKQRITGLKVGKQKWFDARILMEFLGADRTKISPSPPTPSSARDTDGWVEREVSFLVPSGAVFLKFMPALFQAEKGAFDLDDISVTSSDPAPLKKEAAEKDAARLAKELRDSAGRRAKAKALLDSTGSLISNGDFQADKKAHGWPDDWGKAFPGGKWGDENGNRFLGLSSTTPGKTVMVYRMVDIPEGVKALELTWKQRVTGLKRGAAPWFDARIMLEYKDAGGKKTESNPSPAYTQKDTDGWVERTKQFLVPEDALTLVLMPSLFQVNAGNFEIDDIKLKPTDPEILFAQERVAKEAAAERYVAPEEPNREKWPKPLHVQGNRVVDPDGKEVWLQGVNAGGLETIPHDRQVIKSVVVGIDDWKANAIRLPVKEEFWFGRGPTQKDAGKEYREIVDQIITLAANRGAYLILDLHRFRAPKAEHAEFWADAAARYKDHPAVLFDLFNEPHGISWEIWKDGGFVGTKDKNADESAFLSAEDKAKNQGFESVGMQALVKAVRSTGAKNIVVVAGLTWSSDLRGVTRGFALDDSGGNGIMYSWHIYNWHSNWEELMLEAAATFPILVGETGADAKKMDFIPLAAQEDPYTWVPDMLGFIQKHRLNWTGWCLHPAASPVMISDWKYTPTPFWGEFAKQALSGKQFELRKTR